MTRVFLALLDSLCKYCVKIKTENEKIKQVEILTISVSLNEFGWLIIKAVQKRLKKCTNLNFYLFI